MNPFEERKKIVNFIWQILPRHIQEVASPYDINWIAYQLQSNGFHSEKAFSWLVYDEVLKSLSVFLRNVKNGRIHNNPRLEGMLEAYTGMYNEVLKMKERVENNERN